MLIKRGDAQIISIVDDEALENGELSEDAVNKLKIAKEKLPKLNINNSESLPGNKNAN